MLSPRSKFLAPLAGLAALAAMPGAAVAEDYACRSVAGEMPGDPPVEIGFTLDYTDSGHAISRASFQIEGDLGYSTEATEPTSLATVTGLKVADHVIAFRLHYTGDGYDGDIATLHVVTLSEGAHWITAGAFHAVGGGLWAIKCDTPNEG
jgi:hypothetical protein